MQLLLKGGRLVDPFTGKDESTDILVVDGVIEKMASSITAAAAQIIDLKGKVIAPGFIDMHVHLREPGFEHKETILTGVTAAAQGGFTAVCCMPNTNPVVDDESVVRFITTKAASALNGVVDVHPIAAVTLGRKGEHLAPLAELAKAGAVAFSDDGDPVHDAEILRRALEYSAMFNKPIIQHAQDLPLTKGGVMNEGFMSTRLGLNGMPGLAEEVMVARDIRIAKFTGGQYHVAHVSTAGTIEVIRDAKAKGVRVSCEVTPHHLVLTDEMLDTYDTNTKMNPPLRTRDDVEAIRDALRDGTIDAIATDHAPHSFDEKEVEFQQAPFGVVGLETALSLVMTELVRKNTLSLFQIVEKLAVHPRRILHLPEEPVREGTSANLTLFDPTVEWVVTKDVLKSKSKNSPFLGQRLTGRAVGILNNKQIYWCSPS
jgi:dihydroorotase